MKRSFRRALALAIIMAILPIGGLAGSEAHRKLTLMVYMCGSNLESTYSLASSDIWEMMSAKYAEDGISMLLMTGGALSWSVGCNPDECQIQELRHHGMRPVWRSEAKNMGSAETLTQLLRYGKENYPADEYALIFWDHGGGPMEGLCWDELFSLDNLTLEELRRGIEDAELGQKLSWIGFDACLMGSLEVAAAIEPYTDYMIASQETEPAAGWNYNFLSGLAGDQSPVETARRIVDDYVATQALDGEVLTLACLDLKHVREMEDALGRCFAPLARQMDADSFIRLEGQRIHAASFGQPLKDFGDGGYDLVDLADLTDRLEPPEEAGAAMRKALDGLVVYSRSNRDGVNGVSVYHPCYNKEKYLEKWRENYKHLNVNEGYARYVDAFGRFLLGDAMADWSGLAVAAGPLSEGRQTFAMKLTPEQAKNLSSARLLVMMSHQHAADQGWGRYSLVGAFHAALGDDGVLTAEYDGRALFMEGAESVGPLGYFLSTDGHLVTPVTYVPKEGELVINNMNGISVITGDSMDVAESPLGTDTTPNVYYYIGDAPDGARIDQVRIRDTATGMFSNRVAFSEDNYRGMIVWYPLKDLPEPNDKGLLPEYALWDDASAVQGIEMAVHPDWHFAIREGEQPASLLWAAFQITDSQQNTWCTPPVAMENPRLSPVPLEQDVFEAQDAVLTVRATLCTATDDPGLWLDFVLDNTGSPRKFYVDDLVLNAAREVEHFPSFYFSEQDDPYAVNLAGTGKASYFVRARELTGMEKLDTVSFRLSSWDAEDMDTRTAERLTLRFPDLDISGIAPGMTVLGSARGAGYAWDVLSIDRDSRGLALVLRIQNQGDSASYGENALAVVNGSSQLAGEGYVKLPRPGRELVLPVTFPTANHLGWKNHFHMGDTCIQMVDYSLPDLLGDAQIEQIDLVFKQLNGEQYPLVPLRLESPYASPGELPVHEDLWVLRHNLCADEAAPMPLIQGPALEVQIDRLLVGLIGTGVVLKVRNLSDRAALLSLDEAQIDGRSVSVGRYSRDGERIIAAGAETSVVYALGTADSDEDFWPHTFEALRLCLRCDQSGPVWVGLRAADGPVKPVFGGTELSADALRIEAGAWDG